MWSIPLSESREVTVSLLTFHHVMLICFRESFKVEEAIASTKCFSECSSKMPPLKSFPHPVRASTRILYSALGLILGFTLGSRVKFKESLKCSFHQLKERKSIPHPAFTIFVKS